MEKHLFLHEDCKAIDAFHKTNDHIEQKGQYLWNLVLEEGGKRIVIAYPVSENKLKWANDFYTFGV